MVYHTKDYYKLPFIFTIVTVTILGLIPFGMSQVQTEPSMEIDMIAGQTQNPFRIQDENNINVFQVKTNGGFDPLPIETVEVTLSDALYDEWFSIWSYGSPALVCPNSESGTGVYQFSYTVTANDVDGSVDSQGIFTSDKFIPAFTYQFENLDASPIGMDAKVFINDVHVDIPNVVDTSVASGNYVIGVSGQRTLFTGADGNHAYLQEGDVVGFKCFQTSGTADSMRLNHIALHGMPKLTTDALHVSISWVDWGLHTVPLNPIKPAFAGVTWTSWGQCMTVVSTDWEQCWGENSFTGDFQVGIGTELTYNNNGGGDFENATPFMYEFDDGILHEGTTINVVRWK